MLIIVRYGGTYISRATAGVGTGRAFHATLLPAASCHQANVQVHQQQVCTQLCSAVQCSAAQRIASQRTTYTTYRLDYLVWHRSTPTTASLILARWIFYTSSPSSSSSCPAQHVVGRTQDVHGSSMARTATWPSWPITACPGDPVLVPSTRRLPTHRQPTYT